MDSGSGFVRFFCRDSFPEQSVLIFGGGTSGNALKDLAEIMLPFKADNPGDLLDGNISAPHDLLGVKDFNRIDVLLRGGVQIFFEQADDVLRREMKGFAKGLQRQLFADVIEDIIGEMLDFSVRLDGWRQVKERGGLLGDDLR